MKGICLVLLMAITSPVLRAQYSSQSISQFIADIYEQFSEESGEDPDFESFQDELLQLAEFPVNLNSAKREELEKIPFLSQGQIENLMYYVYKSGGMSNLFELQLVEGLDMTDIRRLLPFVRLENAGDNNEFPAFNEIFRYGKNEVYLRLDHQFEKRKGFLTSNNAVPAYSGEDFYHHLKYKFHYKDRVQLSFAAEKDAGEGFFLKNSGGYDFYSASLQIKRAGLLKNFLIGDYKATFGQGLVIRQDGGNVGKSVMTTALINTSQGFKKYGSVNEINFLRGTAFTIEFNKIQIHAFYSDRFIDGNFQDGVFRSVSTTGYHRTDDEIRNKSSVNQKVAGSALVYTGYKWQVGFTTVFNHFSDSLNPLFKPSNAGNLSARNILISGINYRIRLGKFNLFGETALTTENGFAFMSGLTFSPVSRINLSYLYRNYSMNFDNPFASAFSESSSVKNENGSYMGVEIVPFRKWKISAYADIYSFPWLKSGTDFPSGGTDFLMYMQHNPDRYNTMNWKLKYEKVQVNTDISTTNISGVGLKDKISLRYQLQHLSGDFNFKTTFEGNLVSNTNCTYGIAAWQDIGYEAPKFPLKFDLRLMFFDVTDYLNRIYAYEKDVLYAFSIPAFSGTGSRYYLSLSYDITNNLTCWFRLARLIYADDREVTGSGNDLIQGNKKTDFRLLFRWKFPFF